MHIYTLYIHVRPHDTFNTQQASYQFRRGPCDACAADHVINSSRPSASVFSSPAFNYYAQCARRGGGRRPGNEATKLYVSIKTKTEYSNGRDGGSAVRHLHDQRVRHRQQGSPLAVVQSQGRLPQAGKRYERALIVCLSVCSVSCLCISCLALVGYFSTATCFHCLHSCALFIFFQI